jgi:hypothetical protein
MMSQFICWYLNPFLPKPCRTSIFLIFFHAHTHVTTAPPWTTTPFLSSTGRERFASLQFTHPHPPRYPVKRKFWLNWTIYPRQLPIRLGHPLLPLSRQHQLCPVQVVSQGGHFLLLMISFCLKVHDIQYLTLSTVEKRPE